MPDERLDEELREIKHRMETGHCDTDKERLFELVTELREREQAVIAWIENLLAMEPSINKDTPVGYWRGYDKAANDILDFIRNPQGG